MLDMIDSLNVPIYYGLQKDGKPDKEYYGSFPDGTIFVEMDTSTVYRYYSKTNEWIQQS